MMTRHYLLILIICLISNTVLAQDTINCIFFGNFGNAKYEVYNQGKKIKYINFLKHKELRKIGTRKSIPKHSETIDFTIIVQDIKNFNIHTIQILRSGFLRKKYFDTYIDIVYEKKKYLVITPNLKFKKKYSVTYFWSDVFPRFR